jgi:integrase
MASLFKQKKSRFWWINFRDPITGQTNRKSTKLTDFIRARKLCAEYTFKESQLVRASPKENFCQWVEKFLDERYGEKKLRAQCAWRVLKMFLDEHQLTAPRQILREHATLFLDWRKRPNKSKGKYRAGRNTALLEIKFMAILLDEAVRRQQCAFNPWLKLKLHREPGRQKPEYPRRTLAKILWSIRREPPTRKNFFLMSFLIARYHGCRLSETHFNPIQQVELSNRPTITFVVKGDRDHTVFLHPKLVRRFRRLIAAGATKTYEPPKSPAKEWFNFLTRAGIKAQHPGACFHSLRVTAATTFARKGIPEKKAMDYIGHASTTIHRSYVRLKPEDLSVCADAL